MNTPLGDIVPTWLVDGKPSPHCALIRVSEISSVSMMQDHTLRRADKIISIPFFSITLRGVEKPFTCCREDTTSLISAKPIPSEAFLHLWQADPQPAASPTRIATQKFYDDLVIAWADAIKASRSAFTQCPHVHPRGGRCHHQAGHSGSCMTWEQDKTTTCFFDPAPEAQKT